MRQHRAFPVSPAAWRQSGHRVLVACMIIWTTTGTASAETLGQVVESTLKTHPRVLAAAAQWRAATQDLAQARAGFWPSVDLNLGAGNERTDTPQVRAGGVGAVSMARREAGITLSQKLFDGRATSSEVDRQRARVDAASSRLSDVREEFALRAAQVYVEVLKNRRLVKLANDNLRAHLRTRDKVQLRVQGGVNQKVDLQQAMGRVALSKSVTSARAGRLRESNANYQSVVGNPPGQLAEPEVRTTNLVNAGAINADTLAQAIKQASDTAVKVNPSLNAAKAEVTAAEASLRAAKAPNYPRLNLELSANRNQNIAGVPGNFNDEALMLVLRWNLFRGGADRAQERASAERRLAALDTAASTRRSVEEAVAVVLHANATNEERLAFLREHARLSAQVLESYQQQLELGRRTLLDVLNAENELFTARSNLVAGQYDYIVSQYAVEAAQGMLVKSLGITLAD